MARVLGGLDGGRFWGLRQFRGVELQARRAHAHARPFHPGDGDRDGRERGRGQRHLVLALSAFGEREVLSVDPHPVLVVVEDRHDQVLCDDVGISDHRVRDLDLFVGRVGRRAGSPGPTVTVRGLFQFDGVKLHLAGRHGQLRPRVDAHGQPVDALRPFLQVQGVGGGLVVAFGQGQRRGDLPSPKHRCPVHGR